MRHKNGFQFVNQPPPQGAKAVSSYGNVCLGSPGHDLMSKLSHEHWIRPDTYKEHDLGKYTPLQLFFVHPFSDDTEIPQAMFDLAEDGRDQINAIIEPFYITPLLALLGHRFDHSLGVGNFYRPKLVEWLLAHGAEPNMCDREGFSPLHYAVFWLDARAVELLLRYGARIKRKDKLKVINVLFGGIYTRKHHEESQCNSLHPSMWVRMVQNVDLHFTSSHNVGSSCIERWQPGTSLPACTVHHEYHSSWVSERKEQSVHPELVKRWGSLRKAMSRSAEERKREIFKATVRTPKVLPFSKPRAIMRRNSELYRTWSERANPDTIRYSVLD
ncbi:hypothetical protein BDP81DRAFT_429840 [Colletotrichum phormii]|uniref:Uncharacterized protein n=1 Tax=Colletotrichum phormii TaxID=359342 RepID=A0AAI9ZRL9_9PEZI|nr:uncharacterized protein BDP81DRAFT_429840 [Colletotrichum phormii]KAK1635534.1 hypothetical protein BDP81DRAFT_429840 [Colletotrichum phormii]